MKMQELSAWIRCDAPGCRETTTRQTQPVLTPTLESLRKVAHRTGWRTYPPVDRNGGKIDLCPTHVAERKRTSA